MTRTLMARLLWLIRARFVPKKCFGSLRKQIFRDILGKFSFFFYQEYVCCAYSLESPISTLNIQLFIM